MPPTTVQPRMCALGLVRVVCGDSAQAMSQQPPQRQRRTRSVCRLLRDYACMYGGSACVLAAAADDAGAINHDESRVAYYHSGSRQGSEVASNCGH